MILILIVLTALFLFKYSFSIYFFQDDWFLLSISKIKTIGEFLHFFIPRSDVQFYRPLSGEIFYFVGRTIFGLNPLGFHLIVWLFFILNIFLIWKLARKFIYSKSLQLFFVFLYASSGIHYNSLYWLANFSYVLVSFWYFLGILMFINNKINNLWLAVIFILGFFSNEFMLTFLLMILFYILLFAKNQVKRYTSLLGMLCFITLFYLSIRLFIFKPDYGTYEFVFDKSILSSFRWFLLFSLNWPETMKDQMVSWYKVNPRFLATFPREYYLFVLNFMIFASMAVVFPIIAVVKNHKYLKAVQKYQRTIKFGIYWFIVNLLPIIFIPSHISPHQGTIALFGFLLVFAVLLDNISDLLPGFFSKTILTVLCISWLVSSSTSISLNDRVHWIKRRSELARFWTNKIKLVYPIQPKDVTIQIPTEDKEVIVSLNDGKAIKELYKNDDIKVIFSTSSSLLKENY